MIQSPYKSWVLVNFFCKVGFCVQNSCNFSSFHAIFIVIVIWTNILSKDGEFSDEIQANLTPECVKLCYVKLLYSGIKNCPQKLKFPDYNPIFTIGWPSEKSPDVARTRLRPVSQIVNWLAPEFFLAEMLRV